MQLIDRIRAFVRLGPRAPEAPPREPLRIERPVKRREQEPSRLPGFRTLATDRSESGAAGVVRVRLREAFMPSQPVLSRNMFAGRADLLDELIQSVEDQRAHVVLYGERGIGKTSMLRVFTEIAQDSEYLVVHENCGAATRFDQLFRSVAGQIPLLYYGGLSPADSQSAERSSLADLLTDGPNGPNEISRLLAELSGTRSIIVLDEFDRVEDPSFQRDIAELIKNLSDASARVQLVIAGVADNLQELLGHSPSIRRNIIGIAIDRMSDAEVAQIIEIGERHAGVSFDRATKDRLVELALGRPYLTRLLAHHASIAAADRGSGQVENVDLEAALDRAARETQSQLAERTRHAARQSLAENRSAILGVARASLANGGEFTAQELATATGESPAQVEGRIRELLSAHLLEARADEAEISYRFVEESLATYLVLAADSREAQLRG